MAAHTLYVQKSVQCKGERSVKAVGSYITVREYGIEYASDPGTPGTIPNEISYRSGGVPRARTRNALLT